MKMEVEEQDSRCPIASAIDLFNGRWKSSILFHINEEPQRFNTLHRLIPAISSRMLTKQLRDLERDGLITRQVSTASPVKVFYTKTALSESLISIFDQVMEWKEANIKTVVEARQRYDELQGEQPQAD